MWSCVAHLVTMETNQSVSTRPSPRDYDDYRAYLSELIDFLRTSKRGFSFRRFSKRAGYQSPNFLKLVIDGQRNLSDDSIAKFAGAFELGPRETRDFSHLVRFNQARSDEEKNREFRQLLQHRRGVAAELQKAQFEIYSEWYVLVVRELATLPFFKESGQWIAKRLQPMISAREANRALKLLQQVGLLVRDASGTLRAATSKLKTGAEVPLGVRNFHRAMLGHAADSLDSIDKSERHVSSLTQALTKAQYEQLTAKLDSFREELLDLLEAPTEQAETDDKEIYFVGFEVIPMTQKKE
jgi:uncharacterized protein (TIGR02147 family)